MSKRQTKLSTFFKSAGQPGLKLAKVVSAADAGSADTTTGVDSIAAADVARSTDEEEGAVMLVHGESEEEDIDNQDKSESDRDDEGQQGGEEEEDMATSDEGETQTAWGVCSDVS